MNRISRTALSALTTIALLGTAATAAVSVEAEQGDAVKIVVKDRRGDVTGAKNKQQRSIDIYETRYQYRATANPPMLKIAAFVRPGDFRYNTRTWTATFRADGRVYKVVLDGASRVFQMKDGNATEIMGSTSAVEGPNGEMSVKIPTYMLGEASTYANFRITTNYKGTRAKDRAEYLRTINAS